MQRYEFVGRKAELDSLARLYERKPPSLVVVKGRRRVGKSRLISEFAKAKPQSRFWCFTGLAPQKGISAQEQRDFFTRQLALQSGISVDSFQDWSEALAQLSLYIAPGDIVLFDEISWMGAKDPTFVPKLKDWWDRQDKHMLMVLCGSGSTWIEKNILSSTAFFGRINLTLTLNPLPIPDGAELLKKVGMKVSPYDMYKILGIVGGVPWYLEQFDPKHTVDENIRALAFSRDSLFVKEFKIIFADLFGDKGDTYKNILNALKDGAKTLSEIRKSVGFAHSGTLSQMMEQLIVAGFVAKQPLWDLKTTWVQLQSATEDPPAYRLNASWGVA